MASFDSIVIGEDWISEHYFTTDSTKESFQGKVLELRKFWDAEAKEDRTTVRHDFLAGCRELQTQLAALSENPDGAAAAHALARRALGFPGDLTTFSGERAGAELDIPASALPGITGVLFLQAHPVESVDELLDPDTGRLIESATEENKPIAAASKVISAAFRTDQPPAFVVVQAGRWLLLAEAERWAEGRYLAVDLLVVTERRHDTRGGEIDRVVAMLGRHALTPDADGNIWWTGVLEDSVKHTVGVSKDLREGIRLSIEIIANDVVRRRAARGLTLDGIDGQELAKHSLRFLYRILFLLYAEASPEMRVLPAGAPEYGEGYGLDRLRELTLTELVSPHAKNGTHLYASLSTLFRLVDRGHTPHAPEEVADDPAPGLEFNPLRADLFSPNATALIDEVGLGNEATQKVLEHLLLSKESKGRKGADRGFISYAELGINQLGAVYEGLMSYTGFFAEEDLYEVAKDGDPEKGSWVVPMTRADHLSKSDFVKALDEATGELKPVIHHKGTFVFRLAGRERQQSASYYTPEVLTRFVVSQALAELLDQNDTRTTPDEILQLTICEPALGSGAFAIEAARQLASEYLKRKQQDLGKLIDADQYPIELQKVKAHIALHQVYGVDLNATAVELAEISLWLDTMVAGLQAPWFGLHLRRGNSLIGARRAVYSASQLTKKAWLTTSPKDVHLGEEIGAAIHHFLLPSQGWCAVVDTAEAKTYAPEKSEALRLWRNGIRSNPSPAIKKRLTALAQRVETLWGFTLRRLTIAESEIRRDIDLWGSKKSKHTPAVTREQIEKVLHDENGAYRRLRRVMDAWCALWSWPLTTDIEPPDWDQWVGGIESLLGVPPKAGKFEKYGQLNVFNELDWFELDDAECNDLNFAQVQSVDTAAREFPWLTIAQNIADLQGFFHWKLDFASVFTRGGFDLQVGNPPWVRPDWNEAGVLAEFDPWWQLTDKPAEEIKRQKQAETLYLPDAHSELLNERANQAGVKEHLGSIVDRPVLAGLQPDLYRCFMDQTWSNLAPQGSIGLIHPDSHFTEMRARALRREAYTRLRRHWEFRNSFGLFEIQSTRHFAVHIYGKPGIVKFMHAATIHHPETVERSLQHNGTGPAPGIKSPDGRWETSPHSDRIIEVSQSTLDNWASLIEDSSIPANESRMLYPVNTSSASVLRKLAASSRVDDIHPQVFSGWHESGDRKKGIFVAKPDVPSSWRRVILQGPHFTVANPTFQQPKPGAKSRYEVMPIDLTSIPDYFIPRTSYQLSIRDEECDLRYPQYDGRSSANLFRIAWREMIDPTQGRTLHSAIIPPGPTHVNLVQSAYMGSSLRTTVAAGFWSSLISDFLIKLMGSGHAKYGSVSKLPHIDGHPLESKLVLRVLRLNCVVRPYGAIWEELYNPAWQLDSWVPHIGVEYPDRLPLGAVGSEWEWSTPLRCAADRRQALVEIDSLVAIILGITADELLTIYRTQFPVLLNNERDALYDSNGRQLPSKLASEYRKKGSLKAADLTIDGFTYQEPFLGVDRERDMESAHKHFSDLVD